MPLADLGDLFKRTVQGVLETGVGCPPGNDFDAPRPGVAPGNLWDPPSRWQDPSRRAPIPELPDSLDEHPAREEILEGFSPDDYRRLNPDLAPGKSDAELLDDFRESGYALRRLYSSAFTDIVEPGFYVNQIGQGSVDALTALRHYSYQGRFEDRHPNPLSHWFAAQRVHLWQMGKVGSLSIQSALRHQHGIEGVHIHYVDAWHRTQPLVGPHYSRLLRYGSQEIPKIVCGVRDPIERVISGFFQESESLGIDTTDSVGIEEVVHRLAQRFVNDLWITCGWFSHEFFEGVDVYAYPFDHDEGCCEIDAGTARVFLYRQDRLVNLGPRLAKFLGLDALDIPTQNSSAAKPYAARYADVRRAVVLPAEIRDAARSCKMSRHFWPCRSSVC